jgi:hypothetical protein
MHRLKMLDCNTGGAGGVDTLLSLRKSNGRKLMAEELEELIEKARCHVMSPEEAEAQMVSFVYGNRPEGSPRRTKTEIRKTLNLRPSPPDE